MRTANDARAIDYCGGNTTKQIRNAPATRRSKLLALACNPGEDLLLRG